MRRPFGAFLLLIALCATAAADTRRERRTATTAGIVLLSAGAFGFGTGYAIAANTDPDDTFGIGLVFYRMGQFNVLAGGAFAVAGTARLVFRPPHPDDAGESSTSLARNVGIGALVTGVAGGVAALRYHDELGAHALPLETLAAVSIAAGTMLVIKSSMHTPVVVPQAGGAIVSYGGTF